MQMDLVRVWKKIFIEEPFQTAVLTVNALRPHRFSSNPESLIPAFHKDHKLMDILQDVLIVLRCDQRVFLVPSLLSIILEVLQLVTTASKSLYSSIALDNVCLLSVFCLFLMDLFLTSTEMPQSTEDHLGSLLLTQQTAVLQLLIEKVAIEESDVEEGTKQEVQTLICAFLHKVLITDPILIKLICFQTFPLSVIPLLVEGIPSLHITMEYIEEMLQPKNGHQIVFAFHLATSLIENYPLQKKSLSLSFDLFRLRFPRFLTFMTFMNLVTA